MTVWFYMYLNRLCVSQCTLWPKTFDLFLYFATKKKKKNVNIVSLRYAYEKRRFYMYVQTYVRILEQNMKVYYDMNGINHSSSVLSTVNRRSRAKGNYNNFESRTPEGRRILCTFDMQEKCGALNTDDLAHPKSGKIVSG